jgi:uncharacterized protein (UPF0335 family)
MAKIKKEQLEKIVGQNEQLQDIVSRIGVLETQKHALLHEVSQVNKVLEEYKSELESEYGKISIDLATGEYETIEEDAELKKA